MPQDGLINELQIIIEDEKAALESAMVNQSETFRITVFDQTPLIKLVAMRQNGLQSSSELYDLYINWEGIEMCLQDNESPLPVIQSLRRRGSNQGFCLRGKGLTTAGAQLCVAEVPALAVNLAKLMNGVWTA